MFKQGNTPSPKVKSHYNSITYMNFEDLHSTGCPVKQGMTGKKCHSECNEESDEILVRYAHPLAYARDRLTASPSAHCVLDDREMGRSMVKMLGVLALMVILNAGAVQNALAQVEAATSAVELGLKASENLNNLTMFTQGASDGGDGALDPGSGGKSN